MAMAMNPTWLDSTFSSHSEYKISHVDDSTLSLPSSHSVDFVRFLKVESQREPTLSGTIILNPGPLNSEWDLIKGIELSFDLDENDSYIVSDDIFDVYGDGATLEEAYDTYLEALVEFNSIVSEFSDAPNMKLVRKLGQYLRQR